MKADGAGIGRIRASIVNLKAEEIWPLERSPTTILLEGRQLQVVPSGPEIAPDDARGGSSLDIHHASRSRVNRLSLVPMFHFQVKGQRAPVLPFGGRSGPVTICD